MPKHSPPPANTVMMKRFPFSLHLKQSIHFLLKKILELKVLHDKGEPGIELYTVFTFSVSYGIIKVFILYLLYNTMNAVECFMADIIHNTIEMHCVL